MLPTLARHKTARLLPCVVHAVACLDFVTNAPAQDIVFVSYCWCVCLGIGRPCVAQTLHTCVSFLMSTYQNIMSLPKLGVVSKTKSQVKAKLVYRGEMLCTASRTTIGHSTTMASLGPAVCRHGTQRGSH